MSRVCRWEAVRVGRVAGIRAVDVPWSDILAHGDHSPTGIKGITEAVALLLLRSDSVVEVN